MYLLCDAELTVIDTNLQMCKNTPIVWNRVNLSYSHWEYHYTNIDCIFLTSKSSFH